MGLQDWGILLWSHVAESRRRRNNIIDRKSPANGGRSRGSDLCVVSKHLSRVSVHIDMKVEQSLTPVWLSSTLKNISNHFEDSGRYLYTWHWRIIFPVLFIETSNKVFKIKGTKYLTISNANQYHWPFCCWPVLRPKSTRLYRLVDHGSSHQESAWINKCTF